MRTYLLHPCFSPQYHKRSQPWPSFQGSHFSTKVLDCLAPKWDVSGKQCHKSSRISEHCCPRWLHFVNSVTQEVIRTLIAQLQPLCPLAGPTPATMFCAMLFCEAYREMPTASSWADGQERHLISLSLILCLLHVFYSFVIT